MLGIRRPIMGLRRGTQLPLRGRSLWRRVPVLPFKRGSHSHLSLNGWPTSLSSLYRRRPHLLPFRNNRLAPLSLWRNLIRFRWSVHLFFTRRVWRISKINSPFPNCIIPLRRRRPYAVEEALDVISLNHLSPVIKISTTLVGQLDRGV